MPSPVPEPPLKRRSNRKLIWALVGGLALLGAAQFYLLDITGTRSVAWFPGGPERGGERFGRLSGADVDILRTQRNIVDELARRHVGSRLTAGGMHDLRILQQLIDMKVLKPDETFELQALGVALGDVMAAQFDLDWVSVQDEYGRSRGLRLGDTEVVLFPVTMISKRIELDVDFSLDELFRKARKTIEEGRPSGRS